MNRVNWENVALGVVTLVGYCVIVWGLINDWFN